MRNLKTVICVLGAAVLAFSSCNKGTGKIENKMDSVSYALGITQGVMISHEFDEFPGEKINKELFAEALTKAMLADSNAYLISEEKTREIVQNYFSELRKKDEEEHIRLAVANKLHGDSVLAANKQKPGVEVTESGLQYRVIVAGTGKKPAAEDWVKVHYIGRLTDEANTVFDSSYNQGEPATFSVEHVVPGFSEALQLMPVGSKWEIMIPSDLAYGERGAGEFIPTNSVLNFDVELIDIVPDPTKK